MPKIEQDDSTPMCRAGDENLTLETYEQMERRCYEAGRLAGRKEALEAAAEAVDKLHGYPAEDYEPGTIEVRLIRAIDPETLEQKP